VISDYGAVRDIFAGHRYTATMPEAAAAAVKNGCDLTFFHEYDTLPEAVAKGLITEKQIDVSVKRLFAARMKLGMFDPPELVPFSRIPDSVIDSPAHRQIALRAARESIVLLKNQNELLPLGKSIRSLALIGPNADNIATQSGNYAGASSKAVSLLEGLRRRAAAGGVKVEYVQGCGLTAGNHADLKNIPASALSSGGRPGLKGEYFRADGRALVSLVSSGPGQGPFSDALAAAKRADVVIFAGGISAQIEGEEGTPGGGDRADLELPAIQEQLLKALAATGKPLVFVLMSGSAMSINWAQEHVPAILEAWYSGEEGGTAIADVLFGDYNPAGRLPVTFYKGVDQLPDFRNYAMKDRTYRYFSGEPLYPFGYGLSYTKFEYRGLQAPATVKPGQPVTVEATVQNIGARAGDEVVQLYLRPAPGRKVREISPGQPMPRLLLAGFQRIALAPRAASVVRFTLSPEQLLLVNARGERALQPGTWQLFVGGGQPDLSGEPPRSGTGLSGTLTVR
jgi:beta-glucosidase